MPVYLRLFSGTVFAVCLSWCSFANAGVALGATRVIYPEGNKQVQLNVNTTDEKDIFLIQSWTENNNGKKDTNFIITPPLFVMKGKKENILRIISSNVSELPKDRESLFWINVKAIPSLDKNKQKENTLQLAIINRIKFFYRPIGLKIGSDEAQKTVKFVRKNNKIEVINQSPYYLTLTDIKLSNKELGSLMIAPFDKSYLVNEVSGTRISWQTINDYGAITPVKVSDILAE